MSDDIHTLQAEVTRLNELLEERDRIIENLKSVMVAAAEEIQEHWDAHCDKEGYGPANLMHRLKKGLAADYCGYKPGAFLEMANELKTTIAERDSLKEQNERLKDALMFYAGIPGSKGTYLPSEIEELINEK